MAALPPSNYGDLTVEQYLEQDCDQEVLRIHAHTKYLQEKLRALCKEAEEQLKQTYDEQVALLQGQQQQQQQQQQEASPLLNPSQLASSSRLLR